MDRESGAWNRGKGRKKEKEDGGKKGATRAREIEESRGKGRDEEIERWGEKRRKRERRTQTRMHRYIQTYT